MKIACLSRITTAHGVHGGMERHLDALTHGLMARGHTVSVITTGLVGDKPHREYVTHYLPTPPGRYRRAWAVESQRAVRHLHKERQIDVLWGEGAGAEAVARLPRRERPPLVTILHGTFWGEFRTHQRNLQSPRHLALAVLMMWRFFTWRAHIQRADHVVTLNRQDAELLRASFRRLPEITIIPNGVDTDQFAPRSPNFDIRTTYDIPREAPLLITVGRLEREKGVHLTIEALQELRSQNVHLLIVGKGREISRLKGLAASAGLSARVHFAGFVGHQKLPNLYNAADLFLMPTLRQEGHPLVLVEAMACGLPIVASRIGGIPSIVDEGQTGSLIPPGDAKALTKQIDILLSVPERTRAMGVASRSRAVREFSVEGMITETEEVFIKTAKAGRTP